MNEPKPVGPMQFSRRNFLKTAAVGTAAAASLPSVMGQAKQPLNAVILGIGGRGGGAGENFLEAAKLIGAEAKIVAVADLFPEQARRGHEAFGVPSEKCFSGFDAYLKALAEPGVNYAILAAPPGLRPPHFKACIEHGKHVFMEKPVAVDGPGARIMYAAYEEAKKKNLRVAAGTQRRHQAGYIETIKMIQDGVIGDVVSMRAYWVNGGPIWHRGERGDSALERMYRNWYHYIWLSGDHICEQHVHNIDVCNWIMKAHPVKCWGMGARAQLGNKSGEIWDEFSVEYEYENGVRMFSYCSQIKRDWSSVSEYVHGTNGASNPGNNIKYAKGGFWRTSLKLPSMNPYVQEHYNLIEAILKNKDLNEAKTVTDSTLTAIMGREAAFSGMGMEWDAVLNSKFMYGPEQLYKDASKMTWGDFRTLKPPVSGSHDILDDPPKVAVA